MWGAFGKVSILFIDHFSLNCYHIVRFLKTESIDLHLASIVSNRYLKVVIQVSMVQLISRTLILKGCCVYLVQWFSSRDTVGVYEDINQNLWAVSRIFKN